MVKILYISNEEMSSEIKSSLEKYFSDEICINEILVRTEDNNAISLALEPEDTDVDAVVYGIPFCDVFAYGVPLTLPISIRLFVSERNKYKIMAPVLVGNNVLSWQEIDEINIIAKDTITGINYVIHKI